MRSLTRREKILLTVGLVLLVLGGYYYFLHQPMMERQEDLEIELEALEQEYETALDQIDQIPELEDELAELQEEREEILDVGIKEPEEIVAVLNTFSRQTGITINSYSKGEVDGGHSFTLGVEGTYIPILEFVSMVDNWDYRLETEDFSLNADDGEIDMEFSFFFHQWDELEEYLAQLEDVEE